jgi:regulator of cell morphogenesis and NO signaling
MITPKDKLADVLSRNVNLLPIVFRFGIGSNIGHDTIELICSKKGLNLEFFLSVVNTYNSSDYFPSTDAVDLRMLIDFLTKTHDYLKEVSIPQLQNLMVELKRKLPDAKLSLTLEKYFNEYVEKLLQHILFEEENIFPLVTNDGKPEGGDHQKVYDKNLKKLFNQHTKVETELSDLIVVIVQHIPEYSDKQLLFDILHTLSHFELEQIDHARFEDKILIPRLIELLTHKE